jgi:hypothetical protein
MNAMDYHSLQYLVKVRAVAQNSGLRPNSPLLFLPLWTCLATAQEAHARKMKNQILALSYFSNFDRTENKKSP